MQHNVKVACDIKGSAIDQGLDVLVRAHTQDA